jgi:hypothetical protein
MAGLWFAAALVFTSASPQRASAQSTADPWAVPLNLSRSGAATNPAVVVDSEAVTHVVWQDEFADYVYSRLEGDQWTAPEPTDLHLLFELPSSQERNRAAQAPLTTGPNPFFLAGPGPYIFGFWITSTIGVEGTLYASRVLNSDFMDVAAWGEAQRLSSSAAALAAAVDARGDLHLAYLRTVEDAGLPAGIYYTRSTNDGLGWAAPELLYESPYFRRLGSGGANLSLATAGTADAPRVYIAWDNRPRKQVLLAKSTDGGASWEQPMQVAGPAPDSGSTGPFNVRVGATGDRAVVVWQQGQPDSICTQLFRSTQDAGASWSEAHGMLEDLPGCAQANEFVAGQSAASAHPEGWLFLLTTDLQGQAFLSVWNGSQWSEAQAQPVLASFDDPEIYTQVVLGCHRAAWLGERMYIVGCDQGGGGDIWVTSRDLESTAFVFSPPVWSQPMSVTGENLEVAAVELVASGDGLIHAFFSQRQSAANYYTRWDGVSWSRITPVLRLPDGEVGWLATASGPGNELFLIARSSGGAVYFSRANSSDAITASNWSTPTRLPIAHDGKVSPADVAWDAAGTVYVAYSVSVNDERGVYLIQSKDQGKTWSGPVQVFNGARAGFDVVGSPSLLVSVNGLMHVLWRQEAIQADGDSQPLALYYARSEDSGQTFSAAQLVVEAPVAWRAIIADGAGNLHRVWQRSDMTTTLWHQVSFDGGQSWQVAQQLPAEGEIAAITGDTAGRLHLVGGSVGALGHWLWDGSRWQAEAPLRWSLTSKDEGPVESLAAAVNRDGRMVVVLAVPTGADDIVGRQLLYASRTLDLPPIPTTIQETPTQSPSPKYTPTTLPPERSLTPAATVGSGAAPLQGPTNRVNASDPITQLAMGLLPVALLLLTVLGVVALRAARVKAR